MNQDLSTLNTEVAVPSNQPNTTLNSVTSQLETVLPKAVTDSDPQQANPLTVHHVSITADDLDDFRKWQADKRIRRISELSKKYGNDVGSRRNTLVLRRVNCREIAPDEDVLSYLLIYDMKEPLTAEGKKVSVTDTEIKAYLALDYEFTSPPSLEALTAKVKELGGTESDENTEQ